MLSFQKDTRTSITGAPAYAASLTNPMQTAPEKTQLCRMKVRRGSCVLIWGLCVSSGGTSE